MIIKQNDYDNKARVVRTRATTDSPRTGTAAKRLTGREHTKHTDEGTVPTTGGAGRGSPRDSEQPATQNPWMAYRWDVPLNTFRLRVTAGD